MIHEELHESNVFEIQQLRKQLKANDKIIAELLDVVRNCVNFLADLNTKSDRAKSLHKRAYTAHSKTKETDDAH